jgi:tRNA A-37 threonylcarbamoyl transferase component Bud32
MARDRDKQNSAVRAAEVEVVDGKGATLVTVRGVVDERFAGFGKIDATKPIVIDVSAMARMTSFGIRQWSKAIEALPKTLPGLYLLGCPTFFVDQLNMVLNFGGAARVLTVLAPYQCPSCATHSSGTIDVLAHRVMLTAGVVPEKNCPACDSALEFDETPESYFLFVPRYAAKELDPGAAELLLGRGLYRTPAAADVKPPRIIKLVDGPVTYFRIIGTIAHTFRARPLLVGAEGEIVIDLAEVDRFERSGLPEWQRLLKSLAPQVQAITLVDVDDELVEVAGSVIVRTPNLTVWSVRAPYRCRECARRSRESYELSRARWPQVFEPVACTACRGTMQHDTDPVLFAQLQSVAKACPAASGRLIERRDDVLARALEAVPNLDDIDPAVIAVAPPRRRPSVRRTALVAVLPPAGASDVDALGRTPSDRMRMVQDIVEEHGGDLLHREHERMAALFADGLDAAACALEVRALVPRARIALSTGTRTPASIATRAFELLEDGSESVLVDDETAALVNRMFRLDATSSMRLALVEYLDDAPSTPPGRTNRVIGHYRILRHLEIGGMGVLYLAEHVALRRRAVVKLVQEQLLSKELAERFHREAKALAAVPRHPSIVEVLDYGYDDIGRNYLVMEYLEGETLRTRIARDGCLAVDLAVELGIQVASALATAHAVGVIHRDLKPGNIFLVADATAPLGVRVKVLDFGVAKILGDADPKLTRTGNAIGTAHYISPEQWRADGELDHRADIYSLGCVLFEAVTGRPPFDGGYPQLFCAHTEKAPPRPSSLNPLVPARLENTILRMLAKAPAERHANMAEIGVELAES